ncbi:MAG: DUF4340 domain-containing protein [Vicinamibacterales bacterium]
MDPPAMQITVGADSNQATTEIGGTNPEGQHYARDKARSMVFTLDTTLADDLTKGFDEYYKKDLFDSRPFSTDRLTIRRTGEGAGSWSFAKASKDGVDTWSVTPEGGQAAEVDRTKMDDLLSKLSALRVATFVDRSRRTGLDAPLLTVSVSYDSGKFERVRIGRADAAYFGSREGEQPVGEVTADEVNAAIASLDAALAPPPPPSTATPDADATKK